MSHQAFESARQAELDRFFAAYSDLLEVLAHKKLPARRTRGVLEVGCPTTDHA